MAQKELDPTKYERKWVLVELAPKRKPRAAGTLRLFVSNGQLWELDLPAIQKQGSPIFVKTRMTANGEIKNIQIAPIVTAAEVALERLHFGWPELYAPPEPCLIPKTSKVHSSSDGVKIIRSRKNKRVLIIRVLRKSYGDWGARFREDLGPALAYDRKIFLLNLSRLIFLGEEVLGELVVFYKECEKRNVEIILCGLQKKVRERLETTKLITLFPCYETEKEALASCK